MSNNKEAQARIKINKLLEEAGWRFFDTTEGRANIQLENNAKFEQLGDDFENTAYGYIDFLLVDDNQRPLVVLEAKKEGIHPLSAKEQARKYAISQNAPYVILTNGNLHYLWDLENGNPERIFAFPTLESLTRFNTIAPDVTKLVNEPVDRDYITLTQLPNYRDFPEYKDETKREEFEKVQNLRFLRDYQISAIKAIQDSVKKGNKRFLLEMATGVGKTLTAAAAIKLFYKTGNAKRVLFLVDRLELEGQAKKDLNNYLKNDLTIRVYKENKGDWNKADVVITTIQSLLVNNKYKRLFSPTDFDLLISDESHRLLGGGNSRALFEYFLGYKLGLTATPKDYLKNFDSSKSDDPRELERRILLDTYATFGCESGEPTYRFTLAQGAKMGILVQPTVVDARTEITTQLLSDEGYHVLISKSVNEEGEEVSESQKFKQNDFERRFFSDKTNAVFVKTLLDNGLLDPITGEFGKTLVFAVSQNHAAKLALLLNVYAHEKWPNKYKSDFAVQVTSNVLNSQQMTVAFSNDKLLGNSSWASDNEDLSDYKTSKARVCVTVGMMTTGWDCPNLLNLAIMRPIFSPTEFVQIKGRGTRIYKFEHKVKSDYGAELLSVKKETYKLFDFFAVCEYFEAKYKYDQILKLPKISNGQGGEEPPPPPAGIELSKEDKIKSLQESKIGYDGMKVDNMLFQRFEDRVKVDADIINAIEEGNIDGAMGLTVDKYLDKPAEFFTLEKLQKALKIDRQITVRELLEKIFYGNEIKGREALIADEFDKFMATIDADDITDIGALRYFFYAYLTDLSVRQIIDNQEFTELYYNPTLPIENYSQVDDKMKVAIPNYIKTYLPTDKFIHAR